MPCVCMSQSDARLPAVCRRCSATSRNHRMLAITFSLYSLLCYFVSSTSLRLVLVYLGNPEMSMPALLQLFRFACVLVAPTTMRCISTYQYQVYVHFKFYMYNCMCRQFTRVGSTRHFYMLFCVHRSQAESQTRNPPCVHVSCAG